MNIDEFKKVTLDDDIVEVLKEVENGVQVRSVKTGQTYVISKNYLKKPTQKEIADIVIPLL